MIRYGPNVSGNLTDPGAAESDRWSDIVGT
jgi:hypothetical protein